MATIGTALALGKTLAAVDGAAELTLVIGAYVATADSGFGTSTAVTAAGCTAEAKVGSRSAVLRRCAPDRSVRVDAKQQK